MNGKGVFFLLSERRSSIYSFYSFYQNCTPLPAAMHANPVGCRALLLLKPLSQGSYVLDQPLGPFQIGWGLWATLPTLEGARGPDAT